MDEFTRRISALSHDRLVLVCSELRARLDKAEASRREPIAIVGMACRFPGGAVDLDAYWRLLHDGVDAITEVPADRWDAEAFYDPNPDAPGKTYSRVGGHLGEVDRFDPYFFNISPREAVSLDPQYRLLLEVTWEALENAGQNPQELRGTRTGVFVGVGADDYAKLQVRSADPTSITAYTGTGNAYCYGVGRLSYFLGLQGPNFPVDTACSSSLVVTHLACQSLRTRECNLALVGGVHLMLSPVGSIFLSRARALSPTGRCKTFDASADGFVRGEGCGIVVLKRLSDAIADGDRIHAIIRGSAINHDGPSSGFTVPNGMAQQAVIQAALKDAGVGPLAVGYVEAHGTGTSLGDPIEVRALAATLGRTVGRTADQPLALGSVKANIGHLEPAAGVAGLIKTALALQHGAIPPQPHVRQVNPQIALEDGPFSIATHPLPWRRGDAPRIAGISSFGLSGTNAHVVVEEAPRVEESGRTSDRPLHVLTLSARTETALRTLAHRFARHLADDPGQSLANVCFTANAGRARFAHRLAVVATSTTQLQAELHTFAQSPGDARTVRAGKVETGARPRVAFLFTGEGSERAGMGRHLYASEPVFRDAFTSCEAALARELEHPLGAVLYERADGATLLADPVYGHAALFAVEYALLQLWRSWGIEPSAVLGHGVGEYVAATAAGAMSHDEAIRLVVDRARIAARLVSDGRRRAALTTKHGDLRPTVASLTDRVTVLAVNSPRHAVIAAPDAVLHELRDQLAPAGVRVRPGLNGHASPAAAADEAPDHAAVETASIAFRPPQIPMVSATTGEWVTADVDWRAHWASHARQPVRFAAAIETLLGRHRQLLEVGPAPILTSWGQQSTAAAEATWRVSLRTGDDWSELLESLAAFYVDGFPVKWSAFDRPYGRRKVSLPTYPFERERFWLDLTDSRQAAVLVSEDQALRDAGTRSKIERLLRLWGEDGAQAINRMVAAPLIFFASGGQSFFYVNEKGSSMVAVAFVGAPNTYEATARELMEYARGRRLNLVVIAYGEHAEQLRKLGFAMSPVGVWQSITDAQSFSLHAPRMRRLRSKVSAYANRGDCTTKEYRIGSDAALDRHFVELMERWVARKKRKAPFVSLLRDLVLTGRLPSKYRVFLTRRAGEIDSVILLSPIDSRSGYLLDLEFYPTEMPQGCLEFSIVNTIEQLKGEGISYYSLGATYGTQLDPDPNQDPRIRDLLQTFHAEGLLNEDGIFEFKKKFHPHTVRVYVCTLPDSDLASLPDTLLMLAAPDTLGHAEVAATPRRPALDERPIEAAPPGTRVTASSTANGAIHPLLGRRIPLASGAAVFQSALGLRSADHAWLADHRVLDTVVFPAAAYIEMALAAGKAMFPGERPALESVSLVEALPLDDDRSCTLQLTYEQGAGREGTVSVWSTTGGPESGDPNWTLHATGSIGRARSRAGHGNGSGGGASLAEVRSRPLRVIDAEAYYDQVAHFGLAYGASFRVIEELWSGHGEALAHIRLPEPLVEHGGAYQMHPTLLDGCLQVQGASLLASQTGRESPAMYLPVSIERAEVIGTAGTELWVHSRLRPAADDHPEQIVGDLHVWNPAGETVARIDGLAVGRTSVEVLRQVLDTRRDHSEVFCHLDWRPQARHRPKQPSTGEAGTDWVIFTDRGGTGERLAERLREGGGHCVVVHRGERLELSDPDRWYLDPADPEHVQRVFQHVRPLDRVLYAWSADAAPPEALDATSLRDAQQDGCRGLLHVVQALARTERTGAPPQLWILTRGAQPIAVADGPARVNPAQAPVWGLGRTIAQEHPEIWGGIIDLDADQTPADVDHLLTEIADPDEEDHVAYRGGQRYIARLVADATATSMSRLHFRSDATYLVTGGAGGLGHTVARWMIAQGARHLVLVGRTPISPEIRMLLEALERRGAFTATYEEADVSVESDVARVLERIQDTNLPLRGIVHAAGVLADATLLQQSWPRFLDVMGPKVLGSWHLHRLTAALSLDHFVCFSSSASILGAAGQGNYAAANSFMDALAHYRHALGRPALCINWGPWDQVGMSAALDPRARAQRANQGIHALAPARALRLLEDAMQQSRPQVGILSVDWHALLKGAAPILRRSSVFKDLAAAVSTAALEPAGTRHPVLDRFASAAPEERRSLAHAYVLEQVTRLLGAEAHHLDPHEALTLQGFDSLMALELREQVDADLQISMPILTFFRSNSISALSAYVLGELEKRYAGDQAHAAQEVSPAELLARLNDLSDEEVDRALRRELEH